MIRGAVFDADGTLLDSMPIWRDAGARYLESLGITPEPGLGETLFPMSFEEGAAYLKRQYGLEQAAGEIQAGISNIIGGFYRDEAALKPGAAAFLGRLRQKGVPMVLATTGDPLLILAALERQGAAGYFSRTFTCAELSTSKQKPDIYLAAAAFLGCRPKETAVFEDVLHAVRTAGAAGFLAVAVEDAESAAHRAEIQSCAHWYMKDFTHFDDFWSFATGKRSAAALRGKWEEPLCRAKRLRRGKAKGADMKKTALTIAGSDSSGGAGIQADLKTMTMNGVFAMSAITALTAQNTTGVTGILDSTPEFLQLQIDAIFDDIRPDAVKIGMVSSEDLIRVIADRLRHYRAENIVVDPVMVATSGAKLISADAIDALKAELLPLAKIITPNIPEAEALSGLDIRSEADMETAAKAIGDTYGCGVLCKGGHSLSDANDLLYANGTLTWFWGSRIDNPNTHGTGCTLSSAIAANLAKGFDLPASIRRAKEYVSGALSAMLDLGAGRGPMDHAFDLSGRFA